MIWLYLEFFKVVALTALAVKAVLARAWIGALAAVTMVYIAIGLFTIGIIRRPWPVLSDQLGDTLMLSDVLYILAGQVVVAVAIWLHGARTHAKGTPRREVAELFAFMAVIIAIQIGIGASLYAMD
jgi:hypothetical protein